MNLSEALKVSAETSTRLSALQAQNEQPGFWARLKDRAERGYAALKQFIGITEDGPVSGGDPTEKPEAEAANNSFAASVDETIERIQAGKRDSIEFAAKSAGVAKAVSEEALAATPVSAGAVLVTGKDINEHESSRVMAAAQLGLPFLGRLLGKARAFFRGARKVEHELEEAGRLERRAARVERELAEAEGALGGAPRTPRLRDPKTGRFVSDPANPPSPHAFTDAQRRAAWKRLTEDPNSGLSAAERAEIKTRGWRGPQRKNLQTGEMETMELSHEPLPLREGGKQVVPRWPDEHAAVDPFRRLKKNQ